MKKIILMYYNKHPLMNLHPLTLLFKCGPWCKHVDENTCRLIFFSLEARAKHTWDYLLFACFSFSGGLTPLRVWVCE